MGRRDAGLQVLGVMPKGERLGGSLAHLGKQFDSLKEPSPRRGQAEKTTNQPP